MVLLVLGVRHMVMTPTRVARGEEEANGAFSRRRSFFSYYLGRRDVNNWDNRRDGNGAVRHEDSRGPHT